MKIYGFLQQIKILGFSLRKWVKNQFIFTIRPFLVCVNFIGAIFHKVDRLTIIRPFETLTQTKSKRLSLRTHAEKDLAQWIILRLFGSFLAIFSRFHCTNFTLFCDLFYHFLAILGHFETIF